MLSSSSPFVSRELLFERVLFTFSIEIENSNKPLELDSIPLLIRVTDCPLFNKYNDSRVGMTFMQTVIPFIGVFLSAWVFG